MSAYDLVRFSAGALRGHSLRTNLSLLGVAIGVASVILLTSIGEGARGFILNEFTQFGTNLVAVNPGHQETSGMPGLGGTVYPLTLEDGEALARLPGVDEVVPVIYGAAPVEYRERSRSVFVY